jgi:DDE superfamily endonuclease
MWCVPKLDEEYIQRMEEVLNVLSRPAHEPAPVVALDERPVQLLDSARAGTPMAPGKVARRDYEYVRHGTANVFCIVEPKRGRHHTHATANRTAPQFANALKRIARAYPAAKTIHLLMDNLNTHFEKSLTDRFGLAQGRKLWARFTVHYTPKHGSWLNPAELEASLWSRQCLGHDRVASFAELSCRTRAWNARANRARRSINWRFTTADARRVFNYG